MSAPISMTLGTLESQELQARIKNELIRRQWSDGDDDEVMAEYILVMLANNKTSAQIASELEELVGESNGINNTTTGSVKTFVDWLWQERSRIQEVNMASSSRQTEKVQDHTDIRQRRRSQSPVRRSTERQHGTQADRNGYRDRSDRRDDTPRDRKATQSRRELFDTVNRNASSKMASDNMSDSRNDRLMVEADRDSEMIRGHEKRTMKIAGSGSNRLFQRSFQQAQKDVPNTSRELFSNESLFARVSMPDPRAQEFVPKQSVEINLSSRLDPMLPNNQLPSSTDTVLDIDMDGHNTNYPTAPLDNALCRYSVKCTNPMCPFSHPSVASIAWNKDTGDEPLVLKREACRFQFSCNNAECPYSHVSPAVAFVLAKKGENGLNPQIEKAALSGPGPCRFQMECKNPTCTFLHYDLNSGQIVPPPSQKAKDSTQTGQTKLDQALTDGVKKCKFGVHCTRKDCHFSHPCEREIAGHISDRLARFEKSEMEGEMETIIPAAS